MQQQNRLYLCVLGITCLFVRATGTDNGEIRLSDGGSYYGRVEIYYNGWGTVCDDSWDLDDAEVVCRQLGLGPAISAYDSARYGEGSGRILLDDVECSGYEQRLDQCSSRGWYNNDCFHSEDAGVECSSDFYTTTEYTWSVNGQVRLRDGISPNRGRVEVYYYGVWGTVCDDDWDLDDANVVCRQLGYSSAIHAVGSAFFGQGYGSILLDNVNCFGYESSLLACSHNGAYNNDCSHSKDAGVICSSNSDFFPTTPYFWSDSGSVRLRGGITPNQGRVEVYYNGVWGTVCDDTWDLDDANVVCRQLGYSSAINAVGNAYFGEGNGSILLDDVNCYGYESSLLECIYGGTYNTDCSHSEDAGVICASDFYYSVREGSVRLTGPSSENTGRVEIYHFGTWGTVCDDNWTLDEADVVCRQLGYPDGAYSAANSGYYGEADGPILLDDVSCDGTEHYLTDCSHDGWYEHNCDHAEDAGVRCVTPEQYYPRLVNGTTWYEGRVEVWEDEQWKTVCDSTFYTTEARTVCKQLGFSDVEEVYLSGTFGDGFNVASSVYFSCYSYDSALSTCLQYTRFSDYCEGTAIKCKHDEPLSGAAIAGIVFAVLLFCIFIAVTFCIVACQKTSKRNRRPPPSVAVISGVNNFAGGQGTSAPPQPVNFTGGLETPAQPMTFSMPHTNIDEAAPPTYNEAVLNSACFYPPADITSSMNPPPFPQGTVMHTNFAATSSYQVPAYPAFVNISPPSVIHPPSNATNQHNIVQSLPPQPPQQNDPAYPPHHNPSPMCAPPMPQPQYVSQDDSAALSSTLTPTDNPSFAETAQTTTN